MSTSLEIDAKRWRAFQKILRHGIREAGHGMEVRVVEIDPMYGEMHRVFDVCDMVDHYIEKETK